MVMYSPARMDRIFGALANQTRRGILNRLTRQDQTVLERAGLIRRRKAGRYRICRLEAEPLAQAEGWIERMRGYWEERLEALDQYLQEHKQEEHT